jgi:hypothetical protein
MKKSTFQCGVTFQTTGSVVGIAADYRLDGR